MQRLAVKQGLEVPNLKTMLWGYNVAKPRSKLSIQRVVHVQVLAIQEELDMSETNASHRCTLALHCQVIALC